MKKKKCTGVIFGCFFFIFALTSGCVTTPTPFPDEVHSNLKFQVSVNSIAASDANLKGKTYVISSAIKDIKDDDLQFKEFARYIENALAQRGYNRVGSDKEADILIRFGYGLGAPQTTSTYTTSYGYSYQVGWMWYTVPPITATREITYYPLTLSLEAYDLKAPGQQPQLWKTTVERTLYYAEYAHVNDLRIQIPYMIAASSHLFGTNTGRTVRDVTIYGGDQKVFDIMK